MAYSLPHQEALVDPPIGYGLHQINRQLGNEMAKADKPPSVRVTDSLGYRFARLLRVSLLGVDERDIEAAGGGAGMREKTKLLQ